MEKIIMKRGYGKTTQLIKKSAETKNYIVCRNSDEAREIQCKAMKLGLDIPFPITYTEFIEKKYCGKNINGFLIDNVDILLEFISNVPVNAITLSV
jgi:hypothetical protein